LARKSGLSRSRFTGAGFDRGDFRGRIVEALNFLTNFAPDNLISR
jgi:hypothetical protein